MSHISIQLNQEQYKARDILSGTVYLELTEPEPIRALRLEITGIEEAMVSVGSGKSRRVYDEKITILYTKLDLVSDTGIGIGEAISASVNSLLGQSNTTSFEAGVYEFPFSLQLPGYLPATIEKESGSGIQYEIKAIADLPLLRDIKCVVPFWVYEPQFIKKLTALFRRQTKTFMIGQDNVEMEIRLDRDVYFPNSYLKGMITIHNRSSKLINSITLEVNRTRQLYAKGKHSEYKKAFHLVSYHDLNITEGKRTEIEFDCRLFEEMPPSCVAGRLVKWEYFAVFKLSLPWAMDMEMLLPITILGEHAEFGAPDIERILLESR